MPGNIWQMLGSSPQTINEFSELRELDLCVKLTVLIIPLRHTSLSDE
jgi:hypothetical protein